MMNLKIFDKHSPNSIKYRNCVKSPHVLARIDAVLASKNVNKNEIDEIERLMRIASVVYPAPYLMNALFTNTVDQEPNRKSNMDNTKSNQESNTDNTESNQEPDMVSNQESDIESNTESNQESNTDNTEFDTVSNQELNTDNTASGQSKKKSGRKSKSAE